MHLVIEITCKDSYLKGLKWPLYTSVEFYIIHK